MVKKSVDQKIDELAMFVARGFEGVNTDSGQIKKSIVDMEKRLTEHLERIEFSVNGHERRIEVLEDKVRQIGVKIGLRI